MTRERVIALFEDIRGLRAEVIKRARAARHRVAAPAHLAAELLDDPECEAELERCGVDAEIARDLVLGTLDEEPRRRWWHLSSASEGAATFRIYQRAAGVAYGAGLDHVSRALILDALLSQKPPSVVAERLDAIGLESVKLRLHLAHGQVEDAPFPPGQGRGRVVLHNDHFTTQEAVVEILERYFELPTDDATRVMLRTHERGRASIPFEAWTDARDKADAARRWARERGFPLVLTLEP